MRRAVFVLLAAALPSLAASPWLRLTTPDFELYTSAGEKQGRAAIEHFEQVREFFLRASPVRNLADVPVRIVEFGSSEEYRRYSINGSAVAYYLPGAGRDFIAIDEPAMNDFGVATHEYMHLIVRHSGLRLPVWLNEGWAEVYSSLKPVKNGAAIGDLLPGRITELTTGLWLDFATLNSVTQASPIYNEAARSGIFYAESWALVHMLYLAPDYADHFGQFVMELNQGKTADQACQDAWAKSGDQVMEDLRNYFKRRKLVGRIYETPASPGGKREEEAQAVVEPAGDFDVRLALAELAATLGRTGEAKAELKRLEAEHPGQPGVARSLGYVALEEQDRAGAREYYEMAFARGETDPRMCLALALMEQEARQKPDLELAALKRAVASRPDYLAARIELGSAELSRRDFPAAIDAWMGIGRVTPDHAPEVFCGLAYAWLETGDLERARTNVETCAKYSKAEPQTSRVASLRKIIDARSRPSAGVHPGEKLHTASGVAQSLVCRAPGAGDARLQILAGNDVLTFDVPEPSAVELTVSSGSAAALKCGALASFPVQIEFAPPPADSPGIAGIARRIQF